MNKKITGLTIGVMSLLTATVVAAPLNNYEQGKTSVDVGYAFTKDLSLNSTEHSSEFYTLLGDPQVKSTDSSLDLGITIGLNGKLALRGQYERVNAEKLDLDKLKVIGADVLYKYNGYVSPYLGVGRTTISGTNDYRRTNFVKTGFVATAPINEKMTGWTDIAVGSKHYQRLEVGTGYKISDKAEFNVGYKYEQLSSDYSYAVPPRDDYPGESIPPSMQNAVSSNKGGIITGSTKAKVKGWFMGITYKF